MNDRRLKPLYDKRAGFVQLRQALLDKVIGENRGLTDKERTEQKRLADEISKMDELITIARESLDLPPLRAGQGAPIDIGMGTVERGATGSFQPTGYITEHRGLAELVRDIRYPTERRVMAMSVGTTGGFMVPDQLLEQTLAADPETAVISARATTIQPFESAPDAATLIPALDQSGGKGILGGVEMSWIGEGAEKPEVEPELKQIKLEPQEISGHVVVTDKMIRNGGSEFDTFLNRTLGNALAAAQEQTFISGDGVGKPLGILGSPCRIEQPRAGAGAIAYQDFVDMVTVFGPDCWARGFWMISQSALAEVLTMPDPGAGGTLILKPADLRLGTPPSILGLPVIISSRIPPLGSTGDVMLIEASYYLRKLGSGPFILASDGPRFTRNQTIVKIFANVDGQPWLTTPMLMEDGVSEVSPFVVLAA